MGRLPNDLISARRFEMTLDRYWRRHAGLPMANGWWNVLHFTFSQYYINNWKI